MEKKKLTTLLVALGIVIAALIAGLLYTMNQSSQKDDQIAATEEIMTTEKMQLENEYKDLAVEYDGYTMTIHNDSLLKLFNQEKLKMNSIDLSIILGNILDNAIEGCLRDSRSDDDKIIKFNMYYKKESLLIDVENTVDEKTIKKSGNKLLSSKIRKHNKSGYGIANVKQVLDNYGGNMITQTLDDRFKCTILIPFD